MISQIYILVTIYFLLNVHSIVRLDFRRLRASDLKERTTTNENTVDNTSGTKRKAQTSEVNDLNDRFRCFNDKDLV